ncbi:ATPase, P-type, K/Mg/Cd/Cu/Zn/Na/Ca/Na/H-transporter [Penicillium expansum]|uniref:ATPase, P-type, K/Mg/Cd/Cu/Zn/Na/Ca/Na/H-transporter n=1 Tax=Penicillium expansum TaxID=27334 RepID=A0A0A2K6N6_PENEN|nr:ATPase, P-type, K/Mg/Cd/Cu/Zn/Na/Ca/Na/H-transporter [Penicillium expansum]KGO41716.1 ATPase, P-type, K/Mg/Cd/Cu/Zn/Na/Ca/Na/H-transporter [Penicillium expansum]KGO52141.1 ATPase, P-type, K/Mg/Cd/Cu/Zn/Na/Ca/Na/H-transporter [Penicillium expansum]KGO62518.1 ATPase, P-type, K/Mg/Cd/Cu/Zn/Na/Ca/Na/H-transporter [Penicillium expansum]
MGRSCCGATPSQADTINKFVPKNSETSSRENSCGNGDIQNNDDNNTDSSAKATDTCYQEPTDSCKGKARPAACEGGCCDQSSEAIGEKDVPSLGASTSKEACCAEDSTIKAGMLSPSVSCPGTPWLSKPATSVEPTVAECCQGKPSPCCDETCLDRLALRECDTGSSTHRMETAGYSCSSISTPAEGAKINRGACDRHYRSVREQYAARLTALGCICRALLALGKESCCEPRKRSSLGKGRCSERPLKQSLSRVSVESRRTCGMPRSRSPGRSINHGGTYKIAGGVQKSASQGCSANSCCKPNTTTFSDNCVDPCAPEADGRKIKSADSSCADICCTPKKLSLPKDKKSGTVSITPDLEGQAIGVEHAVLSISGMTCTGCETKLNRTLATVAGIKNLRTSLVLSRAEFDLDLNLSTMDFVMKHLERTTEFKCEIITSNGSTMDMIVSGDPFLIVNQAWPDGVSDISLVEKSTIRVSFDPEVVGARDLIEKHWGEIAKLAPICADPALAAGSKHVRHSGFMTLLSAVLTIPVLVMSWAPIPKREIAYSSASLALATVIQVVIAGPFYPTALKALLFSRVIEMDLLIVLSTSAAYIFSVVSFGFLVAGNPLSTSQFFETSTLLVTLIMFGRYIATLARQKAVESISIRSLQAQTALLVNPSNSSEAQEIDVRLLQYGDTFKVLPDVRIPTDGTVTSGSSEVNESMLTGESRPVEKNPKSRVIAGTINGSGSLVVRLTRLPGDNAINTIAAMVDEAKLSKPKIQELADKAASYFVPVIVGLTIVTFVIWVAVGIAIQGKTGSEATVQAVTYAITVLIVSCPCAIGLAVPMVVVICSGIVAERGVIFKSAHSIEVAHRASHVVLDKTGTLTRGKLSVAVEHYLENGESCLSLLLGLVGDSKHPVSVAVVNHLRHKGIFATTVPDVKSLTGRGVEAKLANQSLQAGNSRWLELSTHPLVQPVLTQGYTAFCFTIDGALLAVFGLEDSLRADATHVVKALQKRGVSVHVVSGDDEGAVQNVATKLGIPEGNVHARSSPADKQVYIKSLLGNSSDGKVPIVIFCGDGTNDAVALAQATIGVHMNEGSDVAQSAADVVLMRPDLSGLLTVMNASKVSVRRIKFNFVWSFVYNTFAVLLAAGAFVNSRIPPQFAGLGELISVLPVIIAAVLLRWSKI